MFTESDVRDSNNAKRYMNRFLQLIPTYGGVQGGRDRQRVAACRAEWPEKAAGMTDDELVRVGRLLEEQRGASKKLKRLEDDAMAFQRELRRRNLSIAPDASAPAKHGSGNRGHEGRPGERGGSAPSGTGQRLVAQAADEQRAIAKPAGAPHRIDVYRLLCDAGFVLVDKQMGVALGQPTTSVAANRRRLKEEGYVFVTVELEGIDIGFRVTRRDDRAESRSSRGQSED